MSPRDEAGAVQRRASDPLASTWLRANAGSGKTRVLTDRVARLLVEGVDPQSILCLTYTKAAAGEMQNRLFRRLGHWAMLDDAALTGALRELGAEGPLGEAALARARTLFAQAIETPGGLKIQTIHAFCAGLLRRFPLEAGVSPRFAEIDDSAARHLRAEIVGDLAEATPVLIDDLARHFNGETLDALTEEVANRREDFGQPIGPDAARAMFGLPPGVTRDGLVAQVAGHTGGLLRQLASALAAGSPSEVKALAHLQGIDPDQIGFDDLPALERLFLTGDGARKPFCSKAGRFPTKATREILAPICAALDALMDRVAAGRPLRCGLISAEKTAALHAFAAAFLPAYAERKAEHGWVDFADLILKARALLARPGLADWVLYKLDGGLDHVLVDEAQDTSPAQWDVIEGLAGEFAAGARSQSGRPRTVFVVGDRKQSIYSFQGADPEAFERMWQVLHRSRGIAIADIAMHYSFRSSAAVLKAVDLTFQGDAARGLGDAPVHRAFHDGLPGRVDLWPAIEKDATEEDERPWYEPVDRTAPDAPAPRLARAIARWIRERIAAGETIPRAKGGRKRLDEGDVMVLVQRRSELFHEVIRACKAEGLAVAGADRLRLEAELAVKDLVALMAFLALPEDSLSLAAALRSPLFDWNEGALYTLAAGRTERHLWQRLRAGAADHPETFAVLSDLRAAADFLRPYDLLERILVRHDGRRRLLARLGPEAEDGIDELLAQALAYEDSEPPSLTGFLAWFESETVEAKRQLGTSAGRIRVMTVHSAKGLESPVVILPDTAQPPRSGRREILLSEAGPIWSTRKSDRHPNLDALCEAEAEAEKDELARLLYVAMTRAEVWLVVCAAGQVRRGYWHEQVAQALAEGGADRLETPTGDGLRLAHGDWDSGAVGPAPLTAEPPAPLPDWIGRPAPPSRTPAPPLSPSDLGGEKALPGEAAGLTAEAAMRRGTHLHLLLEHLPQLSPEARAEAALALLAMAEEPAGADEAAALAAEVAPLLARPELAAVFGADALAEVAISGEVPGLGRLSGTIDRLVVGDEQVLCVDFKSNSVVPAAPALVPEGLLRQMGAYERLLSGIYPGRDVRVAILWTRTGTLMELPREIVRAALDRAAKS